MTPTRFGRYTVIKPLTDGGMAHIYLAHDPKLQRDVIIKAPKVDRLTTPTGRERFEREARAVANLDKCPEIVPLYDFDEQDGAPYLVMRYMPGGTLADRIEQRTFALRETVAIIERIAKALDYAHRHGVIHRDVKPANILFDEDGDAFLSDFGIATRAYNDEEADEQTRLRLTEIGTTTGTLGYRSPELARGASDLDGRSDIYSLGAVLFEMLAGEMPIRATTPKIADYRPGLPFGTQKLFDKALAQDRNARFATASELLAALIVLTIAEEASQQEPSPETTTQIIEEFLQQLEDETKKAQAETQQPKPDQQPRPEERPKPDHRPRPDQRPKPDQRPRPEEQPKPDHRPIRKQRMPMPDRPQSGTEQKPPKTERRPATTEKPSDTQSVPTTMDLLLGCGCLILFGAVIIFIISLFFT